jgi:K+-transporting ATPase ATPase C chain
MIIRDLRTSIVLLLALSALTGIAYPLLVTGAAQVFFPAPANGSIVIRNNKAVGSELIGQPFDDPRFFWGRPSATTPIPYNAGASSGSNLGPLNPAFLDTVGRRLERLRAADSTDHRPVPVDLVTASGSGLDPHISIMAALYQVPRVAHARRLPETQVRALVESRIEGRQFGILGEPRINVLLLNIALDEVNNTIPGK